MWKALWLSLSTLERQFFLSKFPRQPAVSTHFIILSNEYFRTLVRAKSGPRARVHYFNSTLPKNPSLIFSRVFPQWRQINFQFPWFNTKYLISTKNYKPISFGDIFEHLWHSKARDHSWARKAFGSRWRQLCFRWSFYKLLIIVCTVTLDLLFIAAIFRPWLHIPFAGCSC